MIKQVILDLHNQYVQVKTQLAVALTEQHLVEEKATEDRAKAGEWMRKAELAVDRGEDGLAKRALDRHNALGQTAELFAEQTEEHKKDVELLRETLSKLEAKLREAESKKALLITQHRTARARTRAGQAAYEASAVAPQATLHRMEDKVREESARAGALFELAEDDLETTFARMERAEELDKQLAELKARRGGGRALTQYRPRGGHLACLLHRHDERGVPHRLRRPALPLTLPSPPTGARVLKQRTG